ESSARLETDEFGKTLYNDFPESDRLVVEAVGKVAGARGVPRAQIALAWLLQKRGVTSPIVGGSKPQQLTAAGAALSLRLSAEAIKMVEAPYVPHRVSGFS